MHALPWPEGGLNLTICNEAECVIEEESVRVRRHSNALKTALRSVRGSVVHEVAAIWRKWLSRRSQKGRLDQAAMHRLLERFPLPRPRIVHRLGT